MATNKNKAITQTNYKRKPTDARKMLAAENVARIKNYDTNPNEILTVVSGDHSRLTEPEQNSANELTYVDGLAASLHETMADMFDLGIVDQETMRLFDKECLTPVGTFDGRAVKALREREQVSQAVLSHYLGVAVNTVGQWERDERKPTGAAAKLLALVDKHGIGYVR